MASFSGYSTSTFTIIIRNSNLFFKESELISRNLPR
ncbi:unnamed protein product, partial [Amoebophrya sp. A120]|eukprot:GSA120T00025600001.1